MKILPASINVLAPSNGRGGGPKGRNGLGGIVDLYGLLRFFSLQLNQKRHFSNNSMDIPYPAVAGNLTFQQYHEGHFSNNSMDIPYPAVAGNPAFQQYHGRHFSNNALDIPYPAVTGNPAFQQHHSRHFSNNAVDIPHTGVVGNLVSDSCVSGKVPHLESTAVFGNDPLEERLQSRLGTVGLQTRREIESSPVGVSSARLGRSIVPGRSVGLGRSVVPGRSVGPGGSAWLDEVGARVGLQKERTIKTSRALPGNGGGSNEKLNRSTAAVSLPPVEKCERGVGLHGLRRFFERAERTEAGAASEGTKRAGGEILENSASGSNRHEIPRSDLSGKLFERRSRLDPNPEKANFTRSSMSGEHYPLKGMFKLQQSNNSSWNLGDGWTRFPGKEDAVDRFHSSHDSKALGGSEALNRITPSQEAVPIDRIWVASSGRSTLKENHWEMGESGNTAQVPAAGIVKGESGELVFPEVNSQQKRRVLSDVNKAMVERIELLARSGSGADEVRLHLFPPELGEVRISMSIKGRKLKASFVVESASVKGIIDGGADRLYEAITREGFVLDHLDVSVGDPGRQAVWEMIDEELSAAIRPAVSRTKGAAFPRPHVTSEGVNVLA